MMHQICIVCNKKGDHTKLAVMDRLINYLSRKKSEENPVVERQRIRNHRFDWSVNNNCPYGLFCNELDDYGAKIRRKSDTLNRLLTYYVEVGDHSDLYEILRMLQGHFPRAYRQLERECRMEDMRRKKEV